MGKKLKFNPAPGWPAPQDPDWLPPAGWQPDPSWPAAPKGWKFVKDARPWPARHKVLTGVGGVVAIVIVASVASSGGSSTTTTANAAGAAAATTKAAAPDKSKAKIGTPVRDGKFEFTVTGVKTTTKPVGPEGVAKKPQGQFVLVAVKVKNISTEPQTMIDQAQELYVGDSKYQADTEAGVLLNNGDNSVFLTTINPGNSASGTLVYDVPVGAKPDRIVVHDSLLSGGATIALQ